MMTSTAVSRSDSAVVSLTFTVLLTQTLLKLGSLTSAASPSCLPTCSCLTPYNSFIRVNQLGYELHDSSSSSAFFIFPSECLATCTPDSLPVTFTLSRWPCHHLYADCTLHNSTVDWTTPRAWNANFTVVQLELSEATAAIATATHSKWAHILPTTDSATFIVTVPLTLNGCFRSSIVSPPTTFATPSQLYTPLIADALFYFTTARSGAQHLWYDHSNNVIQLQHPSLPRVDSHMTDEAATVYHTPAQASDGSDGIADSITCLIPYNSSGITGTIQRDVSGGWYDAGDYLKFTYTTSFVTLLMMHMSDELHVTTVAADTTQHTAMSTLLDQIFDHAAVGFNFLRKMWNADTQQLYLQVGMGDGNSNLLGDHDLWRVPQADDDRAVQPPSSVQCLNGTDATVDSYSYVKYRPLLVANDVTTGLISPNLAGRMTAVFALCAKLYHSTNTSLAADCLTQASTIYSLAQTDPPPAQLVTAFPYDYYPGTNWQADMYVASIMLYEATAHSEMDHVATLAIDPCAYLNTTLYYVQLLLQQHDSLNSSPFTLYDIGMLGHYKLIKLLQQQHSPRQQQCFHELSETYNVTVSQLLNDMTATLDSFEQVANNDPFHAGERSTHML